MQKLLLTPPQALGTLMLIALIQWVGPHVSVFNFSPLASTTNRLLLIGALGLWVGLSLGWRFVQRRKQAGKPDPASAGQAVEGLDCPPPSQPIHEQGELLKQKFQQVLAQLKPQGTRARWWQPHTGVTPGRTELPWYVWIGPPQSGKTTALLNGGLRLALQQSAQALARTPWCEWWLSDEAVWIDTAGRMSTQDQDPKMDAAVWGTFLELLRTHRSSQGLHGVLMALSVEDLLGTPEHLAHTLRCMQLRLHELSETLGACPPVYILLSKMDRLPGFEESFRLLPRDAACQAWGINFPHPKAQAEAQAMSPIVQEGIAHLCQRLSEQCLERLGNEPLLERRKRIFQFLAEFTRCMSEVCTHLEPLLSGGTRFEKPLQIRGLYLSSGTQHTQGHPSGPGRPYFLEDFLHKVVLRESHLAARPSRHAHRQSRLVWGSAAASLLMLGGLVAGWTQSHHLNQEWLSARHDEAVQLQDLARSLSGQQAHPVEALIPLLSALRQHAFPADTTTPWMQRLGLNQSDSIRTVFLRRYHTLLSDQLSPHIQAELEERLSSELRSPSSRVYPALQAYLMWFAPEHYRAESV